MSEVN